ncbi:transcriptional antiterminator BglG [Caloranaerobacter azorensis H53214]|uniref:Transcriptional antiterminator BglG n=1 Tax=Caloranaerobacter azorensis H53214 TaxID=1156417 RepID=A0A096BIF9_9FIRM|nr:BglG family transcription antiterminator [Caloranaerobacter azorensis]KGG80647.1 transcriptional antiterminator BglG [Caloranaerobacter azorensis H53214]
MNYFPNERSWEIINILLDLDKPITINELAEQLNVSNRTIRNDLKELEDYFCSNNYGVTIVKKPRIGVWIEVDEEGKRFLKQAINKSKIYIQPYSSEERQLYIIKRLLQSKGSITMQVLADELYVSRVTVFKDLEEVEKWLNKYNLKLNRRQNHGIEIEGDEKGWRKAAADLIMIFRSNDELRNVLSNTKEIQQDSRLDFENFIQLKELFPDIDVNKIEQILIEAQEKMEFHLADIAYEGLLGHIVISIERLKQNKDIKMDLNQLSAIKQKKEFQIAKWISKRIEKEFNINVPECEVGFIALHVLGSKVQQNYKIDDTESVLENMDPLIINLANEIITLIGNILSVDFSQDKKLLVGLVLHLRPAINRLKYGLSLRNPLLNEIKNNYPSVFGATWAISVLFEKHLGVKVNEEEIAYIATHIGAALERLNNKTRAIVVCNSGIGTAQLVAVRLQKTISDLEIVNIISSHDVAKMKENDFDIIISTIPINYSLKPVIQINPIVSPKDIERIKEYIKNIENTRRFHRDINNITKMDELFNEKFIYTKLDIDDKEEVIKRLGNELVKYGHVEHKFVDAALERENITSTAVGKGVAIPHGMQEYVHKPIIAVATLNKPIDWGGNKVDIVFLLALKFGSGNSTRNFFRRFYSLLDNENILNNIRNSSTNKEILKILTRKDDSSEQYYQ